MELTVIDDFTILFNMEEFRKKTGQMSREEGTGEPLEGGTSYPSSIEKMSEKWRTIQKEGETTENRSFVERHFLTIGLMIGLFIIALIIVIGGFAFLVWNAG